MLRPATNEEVMQRTAAVLETTYRQSEAASHGSVAGRERHIGYVKALRELLVGVTDAPRWRVAPEEELVAQYSAIAAGRSVIGVVPQPEVRGENGEVIRDQRREMVFARLAKGGSTTEEMLTRTGLSRYKITAILTTLVAAERVTKSDDYPPRYARAESARDTDGSL